MEIQIVHILASFKLLAVSSKPNNHYTLEVWESCVYQYNLFFFMYSLHKTTDDNLCDREIASHSFWLQLSMSLLEWLPQYFHMSDLKGWKRQTAEGKITKQQKWWLYFDTVSEERSFFITVSAAVETDLKQFQKKRTRPFHTSSVLWAKFLITK